MKNRFTGSTFTIKSMRDILNHYMVLGLILLSNTLIVSTISNNVSFISYCFINVRINTPFNIVHYIWSLSFMRLVDKILTTYLWHMPNYIFTDVHSTDRGIIFETNCCKDTLWLFSTNKNDFPIIGARLWASAFPCRSYYSHICYLLGRILSVDLAPFVRSLQVWQTFDIVIYAR